MTSNPIPTDAQGSREAAEAKNMAARLTALADRNADLVQEFVDAGEEDLAAAFARISMAWRTVADALAGGPLTGSDDVAAALDRVDEANARARTAIAAARTK